MLRIDCRIRLYKLLGCSAAALAVLLALSSASTAHEIPNDVTVHAFLKPQGQKLHLLVRVPLQAMRDIDFPKRGPGYIDLARVETSLRDAAALWLSDTFELYEGGDRLPPPTVVDALVSLPSDRSFESYDRALEHVTGSRLPDKTEIYWEQGMLDVRLECPIASEQSEFAVRTQLARLGLQVVTVLRFVQPSGAVRAFDLHGDPGLVRLDPRWHQAALRFVELGFFHILDGIDHLLFLLCLVIPFRRLRGLALIVTSFTVAHSVTLIASAYDFAPAALWFPPLVETLIATSIVYMALENIIGSNVHRRWILTFGFGLIHGFGFSFALRDTLQFAGSHMVTSLLSFNLGVEIGQLLVLAIFVPALQLLFRCAVSERLGTIILSAFIAHTGWHWMIDRFNVLRQFSFDWPALDAALLASLLRWTMAFAVFAATIWLVSTVLRSRSHRGETTRQGQWL